ncbi:MAG: B12-binding domain-containing radical SAM protein [Chitinophagales bacterium]|nr:B12-binding domain-containing radical SAM protein [Chitinophagales bacterium]
MNEVLIANTYFLHFDKKQLRQMQPYPPLGTLYAAALLRENGFHVKLFDTTFRKSAKELSSHFTTSCHPEFIEGHNSKLFLIVDDGFNYLTKMCLTNMREAAFEMIRMAKNAGCTVVVSSSDATDHFKEYLNRGADFIVKGEAEITLLELVKKLSIGETEFNNVNGLSFKSGDEIVSTSKREVMHDLDSLPLPAWDLADIDLYRRNWKNHHGYFSINMVTTRGCPFKCNWCAKPIYGNRYNNRSPQNVMDEIKMLLEKFQPDHFWFCDDIFGLKPGWIREFSEIAERENLKFKFKIQCRADLLLEEENISSLAAAGCDEVWIGAESGAQKILDAMDKGTKVEQIFESTRLLKKHGIKPCFFLQFGYPGETIEDIEATKKMLLELMPHDIGVSISYPLPGTKFFEMVKEDLKTKTNWSDSDDLAMMYRGTYSPAFYKQLHRYIHKVYRRQQGLQSLKRIFTAPANIQWRRIFTLPYFIPMSWWNYFTLKRSIAR